MTRLTIAATAVLLSTSASVSHAATLYGHNYGGSDTTLFSIDTGTGAATSGPSTGNSNIGDLTSNTTAGAGAIWGIDIGLSNDLVEIDASTGSTSVIATITGAAAAITSIAYDVVTGVMYGNTTAGFGADKPSLYTIDTTTGAATFVGDIGYNDVFALAFDMSGNLFGIDNASDSFIGIDTTTGLGTTISALSGSWFDMAADPETDVMYVSNSAGNSLFSIDTSTGSTTSVGSYTNADAYNVAGLAFGEVSAVPVPGALPLLLGGFGALAMARRRKG